MNSRELFPVMTQIPQALQTFERRKSIEILKLSRVLHHQMVDKLSTVNSDYFAEIIS